jgi:autotransporter-associated beta strand protein
MGPLGGSVQMTGGSSLLRVVALTPGAPAAAAGLQVGDYLAGADGVPFGVVGTAATSGYVGAVQDFGLAIDRAEGGNGQLAMQVIRPGVGGLTVTATLPVAGELGAAWPHGSAKYDLIFNQSCGWIHTQVQNSSNGDFGYNTGWFGIILLAHPAWNQTAGATPYRNSINKLRTRCENYLNSRALQPVEPSVNQALYDSQAPGLENWDITASALFLALYRSKTGDATADTIVQRAAEMIGHRIQHWQQWDDSLTNWGGGSGRMGHGGVHGDYSHYGGTGALNIINAHALPALALLRNAGANMNVNLGVSINDSSPGPLSPTIEDKFRICWNWLKQATSTSGSDSGNVGYVGAQGGYDSSGRTGGSFAGWHLYGLAPAGDDLAKRDLMADYIARRWFRQQHAHAYTLGGVALSHMAMPFMSDRDQRFFMENSRLFAVMARQPDGTLAYFPGRENNGGDSYLDTTRVAYINAAIAGAFQRGTLPGFPAPNPARLHAAMRSPVNTWLDRAARRAELAGGLAHAVTVDILDAAGAVLAPASYTAAWTQLAGPGATAIGAPASASTALTFPQAGTYRLQLQVTRNGFTLTEPYDFVVGTAPPPDGVAPALTSQPVPLEVANGGSASFTVQVTGSAPMLFQWRRNGQSYGTPSIVPLLTIPAVSAGTAGSFDCVVTNAFGAATSAAATLTVTGVGEFTPGGLWRDVFTGISGTSVADLTGAAKFPNFPDSSGIITAAEAPASVADNYGQRWSGWLTPPETGNYRFHIASDDASELWLSTTGKRANRVRIARVTGYTGARQWSAGGISSLIPMVAGQRYYLEVLHKEGGGGDHCAITWRRPSDAAAPANGSAPLPGAILECQVGGTFDDQITPPANYPPVAGPQNLVVFGGASQVVTLTGSDFENQPLAFSVTANPAKGTLSGTEPNLIYTPLPGASGSDSFRFKVNDGQLDSAEAAVVFTLVPETGANLAVWTGAADANWTSAGNWLGGAVPGASEAVLFDQRSTANLATALNGNRPVKRLVITDPPAAVAIGGSTLTLNAGIEMLAATRDVTLSSALAPSAGQTWSVGLGRTLTVTGAISGSQALAKAGGGLLVLQGVSPASGGWTVQAGILEMRGGGWYAGYVGGSGTLTVQAGATAVNVDTHSFGSSNYAARSLVLNGGRFRLNAETYFQNATLTAGIIDNPPGGGGDIRSSSGGSSVTVNAAAEPSVIAAAFSLVGNATFNVADGAATHDLLVSGPLGSGSTLTKSGAGRLTLSGISPHSGTLAVAAGRLAVTGALASPTVTLASGTRLEGNGSLAGTVSGAGRIEPGLSNTARLTLGGLSQQSGSRCVAGLAGTVAGLEFDQVSVTGAAALAGTLEVTLENGFVPAAGDSFQLLTAGSRSGTWATLVLPSLPADRRWTSTYDPGGTPGFALAVEAVPPYEQWQAAWFGAQAGNPAVAGENADPDRDKIPNFLEFAFALDPNNGAPPAAGQPPGGLPAVESPPGGGLALVFRRNLLAGDLVFTVEQSGDLEDPDSWTAANVVETILSDDGSVRVIRATLVDRPGPPHFLRLRVAPAPGP